MDDINQYLKICDQSKVEASHLILRSETNVQQGVVELIARHEISKLVMGAAADRKYSEKMKVPTSKKAAYVNQYALPSCQISFVCKGKLIYTREPYSNEHRSRSTCLSPDTGTSTSGPTPCRGRSTSRSPSYRRSPWSKWLSTRAASNPNFNVRPEAISNSDSGSSPASRLSIENAIQPSHMAHSVSMENGKVSQPVQLVLPLDHGAACTDVVEEILENKEIQEILDLLKKAAAKVQNLRKQVFLQSQDSQRCHQAKQECLDVRHTARTAERVPVEEKRGRKQDETLLLKVRLELDELVKQQGNTMAELQKMSTEKSSLQDQVAELNITIAMEQGKRKETEESLSKERLEFKHLAEQHQKMKEELQIVSKEKSLLELQVTNWNDTLVKTATKLRKVQNSLEELEREKEVLQKQKDEAVREKLDMQKRMEDAIMENLLSQTQKEDAQRERLEMEKRCEKILKEKLQMQNQRDNALNQVKELLSTREAQQGEASRSVESFIECSSAELVKATDNFSTSNKIGDGNFASVFKGKICNSTVAIKMLKAEKMLCPSDFQSYVDILSWIKHPHLLNVIGASTDALALIYEYLPSGTLEDWLNKKDGTPLLPWNIRTRIFAEICSTLLFLHSLGAVHGNLDPSNILLDSDLHVKVGGFGIARVHATLDEANSHYRDPELTSHDLPTSKSDVYSLGIIILQLLTGKPALRIAMYVQKAVSAGRLHMILDQTAGVWPFIEAVELANLGLKCCEVFWEGRPDMHSEVWKVLEQVSSTAMEVVDKPTSLPRQDIKEPPAHFVCPISQEIMQDPHVAADGFTYEGDAIRQWFNSGHMTSPMTNLRLSNSYLIPNYGLRSAIQEWLQRS
ncbi:U-box domain-containing protein 33-like isoform X2 [Nymphaea colorata]|nr:U-box domain-containing protein 33-like isoform X2 [Nymphaea colorata]XP_031503227.1 U-box domain-containing protein 33-like isoform X2 [Nymphaea colorata]